MVEFNPVRDVVGWAVEFVLRDNGTSVDEFVLDPGFAPTVVAFFAANGLAVVFGLAVVVGFVVVVAGLAVVVFAGVGGGGGGVGLGVVVVVFFVTTLSGVCFPLLDTL